MSITIVRVQPDAIAAFYKEHEREALKAFYDFSVVWHEQVYDIAAFDEEHVVGTVRVRVAASLAHVERIIVAPEHRHMSIGRALLDEACNLGNYYNCHKIFTMVPHQSGAQRFFEACGYKAEAVLPQHTFKLDMAILRKFLL